MKHAELPKLGIMASENCRIDVDGKGWWHLRRFVRTYAHVLGQYELWATSNTADILAEMIGKTVDKDSPVRNLVVTPVGPTFEGVVRLAARIASHTDGLNRILWFQDPEDLLVDRVENYALLRNCNLAGAHLLINAAAHLWAKLELERI